MEQQPITRKRFFQNSTKLLIGGVAGAAGINMIVKNDLQAENVRTTISNWPFPYLALDPEEVRDRAHSLYWNDKDCASGVFGAFTEMLSASIGDPWTNIPMEIMLFGRAGGAGWGSLCGTLNGAGAIISMVTSKADSTALINEIWSWYAQMDLPSPEANAKNYSVQKLPYPLPSNISGSVLCHSSVSQWCMVADELVISTARKERCARLAGDIAAQTAKALNEHFNNTFISTFKDSQDVTDCMGCHTANTMTHMECVSCHTIAHHQASLASGYILTNKYLLNEAYPNPFNSVTNLQFTIPTKEKVRLEIYDIKGRLVNSLIDSDFMEAGTYDIKWNGHSNSGELVVNGIYLAKLTTANFMKTVKISFSR